MQKNKTYEKLIVQKQSYFNPSTNLIVQTIGSSMVSTIKAKMNEKVAKEYVDNIFVKLTDASDN